ncbi:Autophagy-protein 7 (Autophagy-E1-like activating enzyme atg7), partial [Rhizopus stolonifer]
SALLHQAYQSWNQSEYFFLVKKEKDSIRLSSLSTYDNDKEQLFAFVDPSATKGSPGWPLRNLLYLIHTRWGHKTIKVVCYRPNDAYQIECTLEGAYQPLKSVGWERNVQGKLGPRVADLGPLMDPSRLADTAIDLNLKLMRWRLLPELDLDRIKQTKCLLLGAGTLGCYVARCLMGWGVRHITFVDNGKVSFSNPVRQPLYQFKDTLNGTLKAHAAAEHLKTIQPTIVSKGYTFSIPMPGHDHSTLDAVQKDLNQLEDLIKEHDVIFLLTDSRESRWLPTLLGTRHNKCVINSALGFDSYLVMRHGTPVNQIGCYFCNDIVAPSDSLTDRTLDQQCTVTRPGLAAIAGALAVELMVSLIQHPKGIHAPADTATVSSPSSILGLLPHQIRGFLGQFNNMLIIGQSYDKCTACSPKILDAYEKDSVHFLKCVLKDPMVLENITGLTALKEESEAMLLNTDWAEEDDEDF